MTRNRIARRPRACDVDRLRGLLKGVLSSEDCRVAEVHLEACPACRESLERLAAEERFWSRLPDYLGSADSSHSLGDEGPFPSGQRRAWREATREHVVRKLIQPSIVPGILGHFGSFEIERVLGAGATGVVLKGFDLKLHRDVAIKVLSPEYSGNAAARRRFEREARSIAAVVHAHVVPIHAVDAEHDPPYLVMAYVSGQSLQERITRAGPLELKEVLRCGLQAAQGLAAAHAQGIVHRDVKPANILLDEAGRVLLSDFGLARAVDDATMTQLGMLAGTPEYMSPEQSQGETVDQRSDLFSLGCVMYAMCTGHSPFRADTSLAVMKRLCEASPREIREFNPEIPAWLTHVIGKLLCKSPDDRFQTADEVAALLEKCLAHVQQPAIIRLPAELSEVSQDRAVASHPASTGKQPALPRRLTIWSLVTAAAAAILVAGFVFVSRSYEDAAPTVAASVIHLRQSIELQDAWVTSVAFSPDGRSIAGCGYRWIQLFDPRSGRFQKRFMGHKRDLLRIAFSPDGELLASCGRDNSVRLWNVQTGQQVKVLAKLTGITGSVAFSPDGTLLAAACGEPDQNIRIWDVRTGRLKAQAHFHALFLAFSPDGSSLAAGGMRSELMVYDVGDSELPLRYRRQHEGEEMVSCVAFSPDSRQLLSCGWDNTLRLWDTESGRAVRTIKGPDYTRCIESAAFLSGGSRIVSATRDETLQLWETSTGRLLHTHRGNNEAVRGLALSPDEEMAATCGHDMKVKLWGLRLPRLRP